VEDYDSGNVYWCKSGSENQVDGAPGGNIGQGFNGMAGVSTGFGTVLAIDLGSFGESGAIPAYFCVGAVPMSANFPYCSISGNFVAGLGAGTTPFCKNQPKGNCYPDGVALDKKLNFYYADHQNMDVVKCTYASQYQSCSVLKSLTPYAPDNLFIDSSGNIWVSDSSCTGNVWKDSGGVWTVKYKVGDFLDAITMSSANPTKTPHLYVADTGLCSDTAAHIIDLTDGKSLPTPFAFATDIPGLSTGLQFTSLGPNVYSTTDTT
jgi:hypothetical protein